MNFIVHVVEGKMVFKTIHSFHGIMTYLEQNGLVKEECKIFSGDRLKWNECYKEWQHSVISGCSNCDGDTTAWPHGTFPCGISYEDGCPDKGDGGW